MRNLLLFVLVLLVSGSCCRREEAEPNSCSFGVQAEPSPAGAGAAMPTAGSLILPGQPQVGPAGQLVAKKNGACWKALASASFTSPGDTLVIRGKWVEENLTVKIKFAGEGRYEVPVVQRSFHHHNAFFYVTVGQDVYVGKYVLAEPGTVVVERYDAEKKEIEGRFELKMRKTWSYEGQGPDRLDFRQGRFRMGLP